MKKHLIFVLLAALLLSMAACAAPVSSPAATAAAETAATVPDGTDAAVPDSFSYSQLQYTDFLLASGAGAWGTTLYIAPDGSFSGVYHDSEMGDSGEGYPNGTVYYCDFSGQLGEPIRINEYTYELPLLTLHYGHTPDTQEIIGGQRYCYTAAFGLEGAQSLLLYLPGAPVAALPSQYRQWVGLRDGEGVLPFWGLYNESRQFGFSGTDRIQAARDAVTAAEEADAAVTAQMETAPTQLEINDAAQQRYIIWDDALNYLWGVLKQVLDEDTMHRLTEDQLEWIREKEQAAASAAAEYEGGSLYPAVFYTTAADLTKERVYFLLTYLP